MYFWLYKSALRLRIDPVLTKLVLECCTEVDWGKSATKDCLVCYEFTSREVLGLEEDSVQVESALVAVGRLQNFDLGGSSAGPLIESAKGRHQ